ncbi:PRC-barrel domain-containing protein [Mycolicibacterium sp. BK556]
MLDADGTPVGIVDDLEIEIDDRVPRVTAILTGRVLFTRMFGGQQPRSRLQALPWRLVTKLDAAVHLSPEADQFDGLWIEHWLRDRLIARIPGGRHAAQ